MFLIARTQYACLRQNYQHNWHKKYTSVVEDRMEVQEFQVREDALYYRIGGDPTLRSLVDVFYDQVFSHPLIGRLFNTDKEVIKEKQRLFLTQFLGGPPLYSEVHGHPRMRARHMPHPINEEDAYAWLECMAHAVNSLAISEDLKQELFARFPRTAYFMVNQEPAE